MLRTYWHADNTPIATTIDQLLYDLRKDDGADGLIFDAVSFADIIEDADGRIALDAMLSPYNKLETKMGILQKVMERAGTEIKPVSQQLSEPFTQNGTANVACIFELSDGQTISVFFHNPDTTPKKIMPTDEMVSWKWLLNKKDITIVVAPEKGKDLNVRQVATRLMKLAEKNSPAFQRTNAKRAEKMQALEGLKTEVAGLEKTLKDKQHELEVAKIEAEDRGNQANKQPTGQSVNEDKIEQETTQETTTTNQGGLSDAEMVALIASQAFTSIYRKDEAEVWTRTALFSRPGDGTTPDGISGNEYDEAVKSLNATGIYLKRSATTPAGKKLVDEFMPETITKEKLRAFAGKFSNKLQEPTEQTQATPEPASTQTEVAPVEEQTDNDEIKWDLEKEVAVFSEMIASAEAKSQSIDSAARQFIKNKLQGHTVNTRAGKCIINSMSVGKLVDNSGRKGSLKLKAIPYIPEILKNGEPGQDEPLRDKVSNRIKKTSVTAFVPLTHVFDAGDVTMKVRIKLGRRDAFPALVYSLSASEYVMDGIQEEAHYIAYIRQPSEDDSIHAGLIMDSDLIMDNVSDDVNDINIEVLEAWDSEGNLINLEDDEQTAQEPDATPSLFDQPEAVDSDNRVEVILNELARLGWKADKNGKHDILIKGRACIYRYQLINKKKISIHDAKSGNLALVTDTVEFKGSAFEIADKISKAERDINPAPPKVPSTNTPQGIDPVAKSNIEAANISAAIKKKAIAYLNANPARHEIKGLSTKSLDAIMENIKTALFAEVKSLSPLIKQSKLMGGDSLILNIADDGKDSIKILFSDGSYRLSFMVVKDFEGEEIFDSTSTLEGLREWGFYLPFDLDVKAFVANVIKPVVDEFLIKHEGVKNAVISMWDKVLGMTKEEFSEKVFSGNIVINNSINPNHTNQKTISQMVDFLNMIDDAHPNDRDDHGFTDYKETIERKISDLYDDAEVSKKMAEAGIVNQNEYITFLDEPAGSEEQQKTTGKIEGVKNLIGIALSRTDGNKAFSEIGEVSPEVAEKVKLVTGIDVDGFVHGIDEAAIRHVFEEHGDVEAENKRGQIAVTAHDIANLSAVVMSPDDIQKGDEENTIEVSKRIGSEVLVVQEIRTGRKKLVLKTMWKKPISAPDAPLEVSPAEASETFGNQAQENTTTNPQPDATDNSDIDSEIESLKQLIGTPEFSDALDRLLDKLEATGLESQYESIVSDIIIQDAQAESAKVGV